MELSNVLKVSSKSTPNSVAGAIVASLKEFTEKKIELKCVGAGAVNQAVKAVAIARGFVSPSGKELYVIPCFDDIEIDSEERTAIRMFVFEKEVVL